MSSFRGNISSWISLSEPDYYLFFLKVWIPFNAWYVVEMPHLDKKDSKIIKELQDNPKSRPRMKIISLLQGTDKEAIQFKYHLACLHLSLKRKPLLTSSRILSFEDIWLEQNHITHESDTDTSGNKYKAEKKPSYFEAMILNHTGKTLLHLKFPRYDLNDLETHIDYSTLAPRIKKKIHKCFCEINPNKATNVLTKSKRKGEFILLDKETEVRFINKPEVIAAACIKVIYLLRCMLFHGEINPSESNKEVYQHAFYILKIIVDDLK